MENVRKIYVDEEVWYHVPDISTEFEISNIRNKILRVHNENKRKIPVETNGGNQMINYINIDGIKQMIYGARGTSIKRLATCLGLEVKSFHIVCKETSTVNVLKKSFPMLKMSTQVKVGPYLIDVVFNDLKLAIEIDEEYHSSSTRIVQDEQRKTYIEEHSDYKVIRYDVRSCIFELIGMINKEIVCKFNPSVSLLT